ncbi:hypothetical protein LTR04_004091 [Oleoguttula sp. CCFEE 6159]|nr:hypothetical protein LTR04_004091 [Oleoguttula sp. CCFEE 6159]
MASRSTTKRNAHSKKPSSSPLSSQHSTRTPPYPFTLAPSNLSPFLDLLDTSKIYITHVDTLPWQFKRRIFTVPILLNIAIAVLLLYRLYAILPTYLAIFASTLGYWTKETVDKSDKSTKQLLWLSVRRGAMFLIDFVLFRFILPWPVTFFFEAPANPVSWRWRVGFRDQEVIVRVSRKWGTEELLHGVAQGEQNPFFKVRILPAIDRQWMHGKTGYLMMDKNWDLDFALMIEVTALVMVGTLSFDDLQKSVIAYSEELSSWLLWPVHKLDEASSGGEEGRKRIIRFKDTLTALGKESVFFKWIELIQYESSQPGGFTPERQQSAVAKARHVFQEQGIDFEEFLSAVGGVDGLPGLERGR